MNQVDFIAEIQKHESKMFGLAMSILKNEDLAKDGLQEVSIKLWNQLDDFARVENKEAYCMRIIKNWCFDELKRKANNHLRLVHSDYTHVDTTNSEEKTPINNRFNLVKSLLDKLPDKQRIIIELKDFKGFDFEEIATLLEMEQGSVRVNLSRARKRLKQLYNDLMKEKINTIQYGK